MILPIMIAILVGLHGQAEPQPALPAPQAALPPVVRPVPATQPVGPEISSDEVLTGFFSAVEANSGIEQSAKEFVAGLRSKSKERDNKELINLALAAMFPRFKDGLGFIEKEQPSKAVEVLSGLVDSDDPYLAVASAEQAASAMIELERFEECLAMLNRVRTRVTPVSKYSLSPEHYQFMLGYCQVHSLDYDGAQATLEDFLKRFPQAPERLRVTAVQIVTELSRRTPRRLGDVHDLLNSARRHLSHGEVGEPVRQRQSEAIALLEDLIKDAEEQEKSKGQGGGGSKGGDQPKDSQPGGGAQQSTLPGGAEKEAVLRQTRAKPGDTWGKMPPKEREQILQSIQKQFPSRYRDLLEQYYRELSKDQPAP